MPQPVPANLAFDDVVIDFAGRRLLRAGAEQTLEPKAFAVLALLVGSPGRVFTRDEILDAVWGHQHVTPSVLNRIMSLLRQALGEDAQSPRRLHTVHGVGYRFDLPAPSQELEPAQTDAPTAVLQSTPLPPAAAAAPIGTSPLPAAESMSRNTPVRISGRRLAAAAAVTAALVLLLSGLAWLRQHDSESGRMGSADTHASAASAGASSPTEASATSTSPASASTAGTSAPGMSSPSASPPSASPPTRLRPSLAVLPFTDLSQSHDQEYLADGLAEEILNQLAQISALRVVGRSSSFSFRGKNEDLRTIGRKLGVAHLLEGSVRKAGDQLRITAQLITADDGTHLWSKTYAREVRDVFALQDEISRDVAQALSVKLNVVTFNREQGGTTNVEAYERYLRWRSTVMRELYDFPHRRERLQLAREMVALDPQCVLCLDALSDSLDGMAREVDGVQAEQLHAERAAVRARIARIAPDSWVAKRDRSNKLWVEGKRAEAIALAKEIADSGSPTKERVWDYAYMLYAMGHLNDTIALVEQVRAVEPAAVFLSRDLQFDYTAARRYQDAEAEYLRGLTLQGSQRAPIYVAFMRQLAGQRPGGLETLRGLHRELLQETKAYDRPLLRDLGKVLHDRAAMLALVRKALADGARVGIDDIEYASYIADALGDADLAVAALRKVLEAQEGFKERALTQYPYSALWNLPYSRARAHPDYKKLLIEMGVADYWRKTGKWGDGCKPVGTDDFQCQ